MLRIISTRCSYSWEIYGDYNISLLSILYNVRMLNKTKNTLHSYFILHYTLSLNTTFFTIYLKAVIHLFVKKLSAL